MEKRNQKKECRRVQRLVMKDGSRRWVLGQIVDAYSFEKVEGGKVGGKPWRISLVA
jgi:hypothetical protein